MQVCMLYVCMHVGYAGINSLYACLHVEVVQSQLAR